MNKKNKAGIEITIPTWCYTNPDIGAKYLAGEICALIEYAEKHPKKHGYYPMEDWGYWCHTAPMWEKLCAVIFTPVLLPFALLELLWEAICFIPLGICCLGEYVISKIIKKEKAND